ncbi:hypothetical protein OIU84_020258, partial [Salix udensis]
MALSVM